MEEIKITIPTSWSDVTISQFQEYLEVQKRTDIPEYKKIIMGLSVLTDEDETIFYKMPMNYLNTIQTEINYMADEPDINFKNIITVNGKDYGFQKDLHNLTLGEWIDLEHYTTNGDIIQNLHYIAAILYRPIIEKGDEYFDYKIKDYTEIQLENTAKLFQHKLSIQDIYGIAVFFCTIAGELINPMLIYLKEQMETNPKVMENWMQTIMKIKEDEPRRMLIMLTEKLVSGNGIGNFFYGN